MSASPMGNNAYVQQAGTLTASPFVSEVIAFLLSLEGPRPVNKVWDRLEKPSPKKKIKDAKKSPNQILPKGVQNRRLEGSRPNRLIAEFRAYVAKYKCLSQYRLAKDGPLCQMQHFTYRSFMLVFEYSSTFINRAKELSPSFCFHIPCSAEFSQRVKPILWWEITCWALVIT